MKAFAVLAAAIALVASSFAQAPATPVHSPSLLSAKRPAIAGIAFARVYASDPFASDAFYRMLGLPSEPPTDAMQRYQVSAAQWVEVVPLPDPAPAARLAAVGFTTRDAAALLAYLAAKGVAIAEPLQNGQFTVLDPEGNRVVFVQAGTNRFTELRTGGAGDKTSQRIIHVGFMVRSAADEDKFWRDILGFREYWHGGMTDTRTDFQSLQVPDGTDWIEYMLNPNLPPDDAGRARQLGVLDHFSLGVDRMADVVAALKRNGCDAGPQADNCAKTQMGRDGKVQLNVFDPDQTRVEYMEFKPSGPICCSEFKGTHPSAIEEK